VTLPTTEVRDLLLADEKFSAIIPPEKCFALLIPEEFQTVESAPVALLTPISGVPYDFASNRPISKQNAVQLQIWTSYDDENLNEFDDILANIMEPAGWYEYWSFGVVKDPTIDLLVTTWRFQKITYK
jgi:hypothetical protein